MEMLQVKKWAVKDMDFVAHKGQIIAVLGRNGSGKSTSLQIKSLHLSIIKKLPNTHTCT